MLIRSESLDKWSALARTNAGIDSLVTEIPNKLAISLERRAVFGAVAFSEVLELRWSSLVHNMVERPELTPNAWRP